MEKKKVTIIGGGISGLTAGIYLLDNDYDVTILEKHNIVGGCCTGWKRDGIFIDGCAHFIIGTSPKSELYPLWYHIGAINENSKVYLCDYYTKYYIDGEVVTLYTDLEKLRAELMRVGAVDKGRINNMIRTIKRYMLVKIPVTKPTDMMDLFRLSMFGIPMLPLVPRLVHYKHESALEYANKFKSPILRELFNRIIDNNMNIHSIFYMFQAFAQKDGGIIEGGSLKLSLSIGKRFEEKGGHLLTSSAAKRVIINDNTAVGVELENGEIIKSDYVISSADAYHTLNTLLEGKYKYKFFEDKFNDLKTNPLNMGMYVTYLYKNKNIEIPKMANIKTEGLKLFDFNIGDVSIRNYSFDPTITPENGEVLTVLVRVFDQTYDDFKKLSKEDYQKAKMKFAEDIKSYMVKAFNLNDEDLEIIDVATPLTYERYTNAYKGSYESFITTKKTKGLMTTGYIKGLKNFIMTGQWLMPPGGLPIALYTGKHAAIRICKFDKKKFINKEEKKKEKR